MTVSKEWLEGRVESINQLLSRFPKHNLRRLKEHTKAFYIAKLAEMDENNLTKIKI